MDERLLDVDVAVREPSPAIDTKHSIERAICVESSE